MKQHCGQKQAKGNQQTTIRGKIQKEENKEAELDQKPG